MSETAALQATDVSFVYERPQAPLHVLRDFNITVERNELLCILGPSGCGKSTFLRLVMGLAKPTSGSIALHGREIHGPGLDRGMVFQDSALFPWLTVTENVTFGLRRGRVKREVAIARAQETLRIVGIKPEHWDAYPYQLSGGMKHRVAIARAWVLEGADVLLMDEPFSAVDAITRSDLQEHLIRTWTEDPRTVLYVTHDVEEAVYLADRIVVLAPPPTNVSAVFTVDAARPRDRADPHLAETKAAIIAQMGIGAAAARNTMREND